MHSCAQPCIIPDQVFTAHRRRHLPTRARPCLLQRVLWDNSKANVRPRSTVHRRRRLHRRRTSSRPTITYHVQLVYLPSSIIHHMFQVTQQQTALPYLSSTRHIKARRQHILPTNNTSLRKARHESTNRCTQCERHRRHRYHVPSRCPLTTTLKGPRRGPTVRPRSRRCHTQFLLIRFIQLLCTRTNSRIHQVRYTTLSHRTRRSIHRHRHFHDGNRSQPSSKSP